MPVATSSAWRGSRMLSMRRRRKTRERRPPDLRVFVAMNQLELTLSGHATFTVSLKVGLSLYPHSYP